jgi:phosphatidylserine/phosphatidylglycerophosphate/cardiolipin synthase-like enzyme
MQAIPQPTPYTDPVPHCVKVLITAAEAYPALERLFLDAQHEIELGFRIFDPQTKLLSAQGQAVGDTWFHLIVHTLQRGVRLRFVLSDFDPIAGAREHRRAWACKRQLIAARELAGPGARLEVVVAMHPAKMGWLPRLGLWIKARGQLQSHCDDLNALSPAQRKRALLEMPALCPNLKWDEKGHVWPKRGNIPFLRPATHHQKMAVVDQRHLYIGGLDLNNRRLDSPEHERPAAETWHDIQVLVTDPVAAGAAHHHLVHFLDQVAQAAPITPVALPFLRTLSTKRRFRLPFMSPLPQVTEIAATHRELANAATRLIYLETQFFRDVPLARYLAKLARAKPDLAMILILPAAPEDVAFGNSGRMDARFGEHLQVKSLRILRRAFGKRLLVASPVQPVSRTSPDRDTLWGAPLVYVHSKVSVFDDTAAIASSANLNGRSLAWDTEAGLLINTPTDAAHLRQRCFAHWLPQNADAALFNLETAYAAWRALVYRNATLPPERRAGFLVPYDRKPAQDMGTDLPYVPPEMV